MPGGAPRPATWQQPTYPALVLPNITSASGSDSSAAASSASASHRSKKLVLVPAILLSLLALAGLALSLFYFFFSHRNRRANADHKFPPQPPESHRSVSPVDGAGVHPSASADFLYVGTMGDRTTTNGTSSSSGRSPELRLLPPLLQQCRPTDSGSPGVASAWAETDEYDGEEGEKEFYSTRGSSPKTSSSRRTLATPAAVALAMPERFRNVSSPSSPALTLPSPGESDRRSVKSRSESARHVALPPAPLHIAPNPPPPLPVGYWESCVRMPGSPALSPRMVEVEEERARPKPKLKYWDMVVRASSDSERAMVWEWDQLPKHSDSFKVDEEEMMETLFASNPPANNASAVEEKPSTASVAVATVVPVVKRAQKMAILLPSLRVSKEEVCEALLKGNAAERLGVEVLEALLKMAPAPAAAAEEEEEEFLRAVPFAFRRVEAMLYMATFDSEVAYLTDSFQVLEAACDELRSSTLFLKLLDAVLNTGNRRDAHAFKLDTLLTLADGNTSLLHLVVQEINRSADQQAPNSLQRGKLGLQVVAGLGDELANVKKAAAMDSDLLTACIIKLAGGLGKVTNVLRLISEEEEEFHGVISRFVSRADDEIISVQAEESVALSLVKEITEYFHGDLEREEAHPLRIFTVVRDFLSVLDRVCAEVEASSRINDGERTVATCAPHFPVPVNPMLFQRMQTLRAADSDDDDQISSSSSW